MFKTLPQDAAMFAMRWETVGLQIRGIAVSIAAAQNYFHLALGAGEPVRRPRSIETRGRNCFRKSFLKTRLLFENPKQHMNPVSRGFLSLSCQRT